MAAALLAAAPAVIADTSPPAITVIAPAAGVVFDQFLRLEASAKDPDGLGRISFDADGKRIRSFTAHLANGAPVAFTWKRARELSLGEHTITISAADAHDANPVTHHENIATVAVKVRRVDARTLPKIRTRVSIALGGAGRSRNVTGSVTVAGKSPGAAFPLAGKVHVTWQVFSNGRFKTRHKDSDAKIAPFKLAQRLAGKGRWRVSVAFEPQAPYRAATSKVITFTVR